MTPFWGAHAVKTSKVNADVMKRGSILNQVFFIAMQLYGWYNWMYGKRKNRLPTKENEHLNSYTLPTTQLNVTYLSNYGILVWSIISVLTATSIGYYMSHQTNAALPYWDASTTSLSLVAQWLLSRKKLENWILWIVADFLSVGILLDY